MAGQSDQEKAAAGLFNQQKGFQADLTSGKYNVKNRFDTYQEPFGYSDIQKQLDQIFSGQTDLINKNTANQIATSQGGATSSLASRGITGGSIVNDTNSGIASDINLSKMNALGNLGTQKASSMANLMEYINQLKQQETQSATNVDLANTGNVLNALSGSYSQQRGVLPGMSSGTWLDDLFAGLGTAAKVGSTIAAF